MQRDVAAQAQLLQQHSHPASVGALLAARRITGWGRGLGPALTSFVRAPPTARRRIAGWGPLLQALYERRPRRDGSRSGDRSYKLCRSAASSAISQRKRSSYNNAPTAGCAYSLTRISAAPTPPNRATPGIPAIRKYPVRANRRAHNFVPRAMRRRTVRVSL